MRKNNSKTEENGNNANRVLAVVYCDMGVDREYSYNRFSDKQMRPFISHCLFKAKYRITAENKNGFQQTMNVCERHKNDIYKRFKVIECFSLNNC